MSATIVRFNEGKDQTAFGDSIRFKIGPEESQGRLTVGFGTTPPGGGPPPHVHHNEDECFIVWQGKMEFLVDGEWIPGNPGDVVFLPKDTPHTFRNPGQDVCSHFVITNPCGFETFFTRCSDEFARDTGPDMDKIMAICKDHGIEVLVPVATPA